MGGSIKPDTIKEHVRLLVESGKIEVRRCGYGLDYGSIGRLTLKGHEALEVGSTDA